MALKFVKTSMVEEKVDLSVECGCGRSVSGNEIITARNGIVVISCCPFCIGEAIKKGYSVPEDGRII